MEQHIQGGVSPGWGNPQGHTTNDGTTHTKNIKHWRKTNTSKPKMLTETIIIKIILILSSIVYKFFPLFKIKLEFLKSFLPYFISLLLKSVILPPACFKIAWPAAISHS